MEYPKIDTLFERDGHFRIDIARLRHPVYATIREWDVTEKVDGTNMRVLMDEQGNVRFGGRTERANIPADLVMYMMNTFPRDRVISAFQQEGEPLPSVVLYGEGYGAGIQKGGGYRQDKAFRLFDVLVAGKWWLDWPNVCDVARKLEIATVPYLGRWTLDEIVVRVREGIPSITAEEDSGQQILSEGVVAKPIETLFDKKGSRVILKLKTKDF
jgi:hypothetical protein